MPLDVKLFPYTKHGVISPLNIEDWEGGRRKVAERQHKPKGTPAAMPDASDQAAKQGRRDDNFASISM